MRLIIIELLQVTELLASPVELLSAMSSSYLAVVVEQMVLAAVAVVELVDVLITHLSL
jgi:hypothetical protein